MTFSIIAFDTQSGRTGVAITTSSIAVGSRCPWVRAGVGAVATQNITDPTLGVKILNLIETGNSASQAIQKIVQSQNNISYRQLTAVDGHGGVGHYTGSYILGTNAVAMGESCVAAGNLLANQSVPQVMIDSYCNSSNEKHLALRLLEALQAGINAGGEEGDVHSAALLVASQYSWPEVDLRVDWADEEPVKQLHELWLDYQPQSNDYLLRAISPELAPAYGVPGDL